MRGSLDETERPPGIGGNGTRLIEKLWPDVPRCMENADDLDMVGPDAIIENEGLDRKGSKAGPKSGAFSPRMRLLGQHGCHFVEAMQHPIGGRETILGDMKPDI